MPTDFDLVVKGKKPIPAEQMHREGKFPPFFEFKKPGTYITGKISDYRELETQFGKAQAVTLTTAEGIEYSIGLTSRLDGLREMVGKTVAIRYMGDERTGSFYTKDFEVYEI